jgi:hypothetical protein
MTPPALSAAAQLRVHRMHGREITAALPCLEEYVQRARPTALSRFPGWLPVLQHGLGHDPYCLEAATGQRTGGFLPSAHIHSFLFGSYLVSLPYLNSAGVFAEDAATGQQLVEQAVALADELKVRFLEVRHETPIEHPALTQKKTDKVHMRLPLPERVLGTGSTPCHLSQRRVTLPQGLCHKHPSTLKSS